MDHRSPLENIFNIIGGLPQGHDKPVKHALYNAVALFLLVVSCATGWALYLVLEPFIKPLLWALLVGSVLHPLKHSLRWHFQRWLRDIEESATPFLLGMCVLPFSIVNNVSELIGSGLLKYFKWIVGGVVVVAVLHVLWFYTPGVVVAVLWKVGGLLWGVTNFFIDGANFLVITILLIGYISTMALMWRPENNKTFHYISIGIWLLLSCSFAHQFGSFRLIIFVLLQLILLGGFISEIRNLQENFSNEGQTVSLFEAAFLIFNNQPSTTIKPDENQTTESTENPEHKTTSKPKDPYSLDLFEDVKTTTSETNLSSKPKMRIKEPKIVRSLSQPHVTTAKPRNYFTLFNAREKKRPETAQNASDFYLYTLMWACVVMLFWKNLMLLPILPIPILIYSVKHVGWYLGIWGVLNGYYVIVKGHLLAWSGERIDAIVPVPIRGLYRILQAVNASLKNSIKASIDSVASCVVIFALLVFVGCASTFFVFQIYTEAIMLAQMFSNVINQTVVHNPELRQLLPPTFDDTVDSILDNAYQYGREGISKAVKSVMSDVDSAKSVKLEKQVLELWDRVYQAWMSTEDGHGPKVTQAAVESSWNAFLDDIKISPDMFNIKGLTEFLKQNVGTLMSLLESVWSIVKGNISLVLGSFSAFLSVILGGGTAVLNFILNVIVFLTTLFYLLSSSGELYKPVELLTNFSSSGNRFGVALEGAVNGVFRASFKMAIFYGLWTWFIHNLFGLKIVYLPSAFATVFGAAPFLGTYWACIPGVLDLWLGHNEGFLAVLFAIFQFLPTSVVDTTIYKEIKGGSHPYLTGLAIAGGIFCFGIEGAILGPLLLCALYVAVDLSSSLFKDSPSEESLNLQLQLQNS